MYTIYIHTSKITGKSYVGYTLTKKTAERRWLEHCKNADEGSDCVFHKAIRKYGKEEWLHEILQQQVNSEDVLEVEKFWIKEKRSHCSESGYNMTFGGDGCVGLAISKETKAKMSQSHKGKKISDAAKEKLREKATGRKLEPASREKVGAATVQRFSSIEFREMHSARTKEAMQNLDAAAREKLRSRQRPVEKFTQDGIFIERYSSVSAAALSVNVTATAIGSCVSGKSRTCKGFVWKYAET